MSNKKRYNWQDFTIPFFIVLVYILHRASLLSGQNWHFTPFASVGLATYSDVLVMLLLLSMIKPGKKIPVNHAHSKLLVEDDRYSEIKDYLKRSDYAKHIATIISGQNSTKSFAIALRGKWGSGKSIFLHQLTDHLENCELVCFNPWLGKESDHLLADFYHMVIERISPYNPELSVKFRKYADNLLSIREGFKVNIPMLLGLEKNNRNLLGLEAQKNKLAEDLQTSRIRIVVTIDDLDRLNGKDMLSVLSLIRSSFDMPRVVFIVAYDTEYVYQMLTQANIARPQQYLEKIFQLEIDLPTFPMEILQSELENLLVAGKNEAEKARIVLALKDIIRAIELQNIVTNIRDCVRLANSFNLVYDKKSKETNLSDYLMLEICRLRYNKFYEGLREILQTGDGNRFLQFPDIFSNLPIVIKFVGNKINKEEFPDQVDIIQRIGQFLFSETEKAEPEKALRIRGNELRYFSDHLFGVISFQQLDLYKTDLPGFLKMIKETIAVGNRSAIGELLMRITPLYTEELIFNYCKGLCYYTAGTGDFGMFPQRVSVFVLDEKIFTNVFKTEEKLNEFVEKLVNTDDTMNYLGFAIVAGCLLQNSFFIKSSGRLHLDTNKLLERIEFYLEKLTELATTYNSDLYLIYVKAIKEVNTDNKIVISQKANDIMGRYVTKHFDAYLPTLLQDFEPSELSLDAFIEQFLGWATFKVLVDQAKENYWQHRVSSFLKEFSFNGYKPISYDLSFITVYSEKHKIKRENKSEPSPVSSNHDEKKGAFVSIDGAEVIEYCFYQNDNDSNLTAQFSYAIDLTGAPNLPVNATLEMIVSDIIEIKVNDSLINKTINIGPSAKNSERLVSSYGVSSAIMLAGRNRITFVIRPSSYTSNLPENKLEDYIGAFSFCIKIRFR